MTQAVMTEEEKYYFDLRGHLVVPSVLDADEIAVCIAAIEHHASQIRTRDVDGGGLAGGSPTLMGREGRQELTGMLGWPEPHCIPFRPLLAHPHVVSRLNIMCGPEDGGFACVAGSHKSGFPIPYGVKTADEDMGLVEQPSLQARDVLFFMDGAQSHGPMPWQAEHERRSVLFKYASCTATRTGKSRELADPEVFWGEELVAGMTAEERVVMHGPCSSLSEGVRLTVENGEVHVLE
ncbi:MAG: hypothetical protein VX733_01675 [Candidatus Latescibacterota bacterium]|nr:hypothetical protein [Candidatus Latescibacterota bacterium]